MKDIIKLKKINQLTKKFPMWNKIFITWLTQDENLDMTQLDLGFTTLMKYKQLLSSDINTKYASHLINTDLNKSISISEHFNDYIQKTLFLRQKENFIKSLKTKSYKHLFNQQNENEIGLILDNGITISSLKHQLFNKLLRYKTETELYHALQDFKKQNIHWNNDYFIEKIKDCNATIIDNCNQRLTIEIHDFEACKALGPQSWCIAQNKRTFKQYVKDMSRQFIIYDFNLPIEENESIIGFTVLYDGEIKNSHLKNDDMTSKDIRSNFKFSKMPENRMLDIVRSKSGDHFKQIELLLIIGKTDLFEISKEFSKEFKLFLHEIKEDTCNKSFLRKVITSAVTSNHNHNKIIKEIFSRINIRQNRDDCDEDEAYTQVDSYRALIHALQHYNFDIFKTIIKNKDIDLSYNNDQLLKRSYDICQHFEGQDVAIKNIHKNIHKAAFDLLITDKRVNQNFLVDYDFIKFVRSSEISITTDIELRNKLFNPNLDPFAYNNEAIKSSFLLGREDMFDLLLTSNKITDNINPIDILSDFASTRTLTPHIFKSILNIENSNFNNGTVPYQYYNRFLETSCENIEILDLILSQSSFKEQPKLNIDKITNKLFQSIHHKKTLLTLLKQKFYPTEDLAQYHIHNLFDFMISKETQKQEQFDHRYWEKIITISPEVTRKKSMPTLEKLSMNDDLKSIKILCKNKDILLGVQEYYNKNSMYNGAFSDTYYQSIGLKPNYSDRLSSPHRKYILKKLKNINKSKNILGF